ncbi:hypothetical protein TNCV_17721 [Trichonephila clavipes]|nr:hypothetical protein TNCV_17721 [Trichonephila clavipes]
MHTSSFSVNPTPHADNQRDVHPGRGYRKLKGKIVGYVHGLVARTSLVDFFVPLKTPRGVGWMHAESVGLNWCASLEKRVQVFVT